jgi:subtilisin family serine protease
MRSRRRQAVILACGVALLAVPAAALGLRSSGARSRFLDTAAPTKVERSIHGLPSRLTQLPKLDSSLAGLVAPKQSFSLRGARISEAAPALVHGKVRVDVTTANAPAARAAILRLGGRMEGAWSDVVTALVPPRSLAALSRLPSVRFVGAPPRMFEDAVPGEEVGASLASAWQAQGITGKGVKVAVIDGGFGGLADRQASGDLPTNIVTADFCLGRFASSGEIHGTAVAEIVHEMAPDAQLYLACTTDETSVSQAEKWARSQGVKVINFSAGFPASGRGDGTGLIGSVVADARAGGILWVNAAGNQAQTHWSGTFTDTDGDGLEDWAPNDIGNTFVWPNGSQICGILKWDEWPIAVSDFDLELIDSNTGNVLVSSNTVQNGSQPPLEAFCTVPNPTGSNLTVAWVIVGNHVVGSPQLDLISESPPLQYTVAAGSVIDPATSASAFAVGALCWQTGALESYSSQGPTIDGRVKPDIAGHDSVSSATYGAFSGICPSGFAGTSAASPEVAGAAALVKQAHPAFGPDQLQSFLEQNAIDLGAPGKDDQTGVGALHFPSSVGVTDTTPPKARALASSGERGHLVKLRSRLFDDSGEVRIREQVKQNGHVIKTLTSGFVSVPSAETRFSNWRAPVSIKGSIQHCVRDQDPAGNLSPVSCAKVTLSG